MSWYCDRWGPKKKKTGTFSGPKNIHWMLTYYVKFLHICRKMPWFMWGHMHVQLSISQILLQNRPGFSNAIYNKALSRPTTVFHQRAFNSKLHNTKSTHMHLGCVSHCFTYVSIYNSNAFNWNAEEHLLLMHLGLILTTRQVGVLLLANAYSMHLC